MIEEMIGKVVEQFVLNQTVQEVKYDGGNNFSICLSNGLELSFTVTNVWTRNMK